MDLSNKNVIHVKKDKIEYLQFRKLLEYSDIICHAYSLGVDKNYRTSRVNKENLSKEEYQKAIGDYKKLCESIGADYKNLVKTSQEHTDQISIVTKKVNDDMPDINLDIYKSTDGLITNKNGLILSTTNADCILMIFFDPVEKVIANVHSGWRGTLQRICVKAVNKMVQNYECKKENIICCICPSIRKCHFEVEEDVEKLFKKEFQDLKHEQLEKIIEEKVPNKKWNIDTVLINQIILENIGLKKENIIDSKICSVCNSEIIHSYRVEKQKYGLNTALVGLVAPIMHSK